MMRSLALLLALMLVVAACNSAPVAAPGVGASEAPTSFVVGNPTVPPTVTGAGVSSLADLPLLPDALTTTPGDRFSIQTTAATPAEVEAFYTPALVALGMTLADRQEGAVGIFGRGLLLHYVDAGGSVDVYVMVLPEFENQATGVLLTLDALIVRPPADAP